jgi:hypothetical protein
MKLLNLNSFKKNNLLNINHKSVLNLVKSNTKNFRTNNSLIKLNKQTYLKNYLEKSNKFLEQSVNKSFNIRLLNYLKYCGVEGFFTLKLIKESSKRGKRNFSTIILSFLRLITKAVKNLFTSFLNFFENVTNGIVGYFKNFSLLRTLFFLLIFFAYFGTPHSILSK